MNVERYIAIKHPLQYETIVTENRLTCLSVLLWITAILLTVPLSFADNNLYLTVDNSTMFLCMAIIFYCQIVLYYETRRHQKEIAAQQVSLEAREKFLKEKKAFKLTTTVLLLFNTVLFTFNISTNSNIKVCHQISQFSIYRPLCRHNCGNFQLDRKPNYILCKNKTVSCCVYSTGV